MQIAYAIIISKYKDENIYEAFLALLLIFVLLIVATSGVAAKKFEGDGFDSPEAAVMAYVEAFIAGDVTAMLSTFAIESYIDNTDRVALLERIRGVSLRELHMIPLANDDIRELEIANRYGLLAESLLYQYLSYHVPEEYNERFERTLQLHAEGYGCDELRNMIVQLNIGGEDYLLCMDCVRYGDKWYNCSFSGVLGSYIGISSSYAGLILMSEVID